MFEQGRRFDAIDIILVVVVFVGALALKLAGFAQYMIPAFIAFGGGALVLRQRLFPKQGPSIAPLQPPVTTPRSVFGAICLALGMVFAPLSGLVLAVFVVREVALRDGKGLDVLLLSLVVFAVSVAMLRFAFRVGRNR